MERSFLKVTVMLGCACSLAACGGGSGTTVASTPSPTPSPTPALGSNVQLLSAANANTTTLISAGAGVSYDYLGNTSSTIRPAIEIRYVPSAPRYEVRIPGDTFKTIVPSGNPSTPVWRSGDYSVYAYGQSIATGYSSSNILSYSHGSTQGVLAFGIPTPSSAIPVTGSATYNGAILGVTTELQGTVWDYGLYPATIAGSINMAFNFGAGSLSGSISPTLKAYDDFALGSFAFKDTVYSTGSTTFSGAFAGMPAGNNSFSGQFTGASAQEVVGGFAFPYVSPVDGLTYQASGGFIGKK